MQFLIMTGLARVVKTVSDHLKSNTNYKKKKKDFSLLRCCKYVYLVNFLRVA